MRILVNQDEISIFQKNVMAKIDVIEEDIKKMRSLRNELIWNGKSSVTFKNKYDENVEELDKRVETLSRYVKFLDEFNSKYNKVQDSIRGEYSRMKGGTNG